MKSRLSTGPFNLNLLFPVGLLSFLIKSLVAFSSTNFLAKFFFFDSLLKFILGKAEVLFCDLLDLNGYFFSTEKDFLPDVEMELVSIFFFKSDEIVSVFFLSLSITLLVHYLSS